MVTRVDAFNSSKLLIRLGNGASPETFAHPCMINTSRGISFTSNPTEVLIPFCPPDSDLAGWIEREPDSFSASITGAGVFDMNSHDEFRLWWLSGLSKNIQVAIEELGYWWGSAILSAFAINGAGRREKATFDCTILSDGPWDFRTTT